MSDAFTRTEMLLGAENIEKLKNAHIAIFGLGGVGGHAVEALARCGVGHFTIFDSDTVAESNLNRQIIATIETIGQKKTEAMKNRILSINPSAEIITHDVFYLPENADNFDLSAYSYIVDAIDTVSAKLELAVRAQTLDVPIISSMGTGNKLNPTDLKVCDIYKTSGCPLARVMRRELKSRGIKKLKVVYSEETPLKPLFSENPDSKKQSPGSTSFVPSVAGLIIASEVIKDICGI
ncbi:MAG: tRNA threonylcarbamoyladenosine dehydratase [Ruminococcaceae bacterium]|nr:tRNA threonylcarbamoyladenosine dehydratase [Oscillospiraceae bacterium]